MRKKVLIIEDKYYEVKVSFDYVNALHMNNELDIKVADRSQVIPFDIIESYDYVFVDIKLGKNSNLDGYDILLKFEHEYPNVKNVIILTGNNKILDNLKLKGIERDYRVLIKPIDFSELVKVFTE
mgnify:CR=1 FL=1